MEVTVIHTLKTFINSVNQKLNRLLLFALTAGLSFPTAVRSAETYYWNDNDTIISHLYWD